MTRFIKILAPLGASLALGACSISYNIAGFFENSDQTFSGKVSVALNDSGTLDVATDDGSLACKGTSKVVQKASPFSRTGARATAQAACNDGRSFKVEVVQDRDSGGSGEGVDTLGNIVHVFFDQQMSVAKSAAQKEKMAMMRANQPAPPAAPAQRSAEERLRELQKLKDDKLITDEEYQTRRNAILSGL